MRAPGSVKSPFVYPRGGPSDSGLMNLISVQCAVSGKQCAVKITSPRGAHSALHCTLLTAHCLLKKNRAAVNVDRLTRDAAAGFGGEEQSERCALFRSDEPVLRTHALDGFERLGGRAP